MAPPRNKTQVKINAFTSAHLMYLLLDGDRTIDELSEETGLHRITVERYLRALHARGAAFIHRWDPNRQGRHVIKIYKLGRGKDAPRVRLTAAERGARRRAKVKSQQMAAVTAGRGQFVPSGNGRYRYEEVPCAS